MKKQLLFIILAFFAMSQSFGQNTAFDPPTCVATALSPAPGEKYTYQVTISGPTGAFDGDGNYKWYVTDNVDLLLNSAIINNDGSIFTASGGGSYNLATGGTNTIDIVWTSAALATAKPYYLVIRYQEANGTSGTPSCEAMNMKVYRIVPINTFWLRIESVADATGTAGGSIQCAAEVSKAVITEPAGTVEYTYGQNVLYVKVSASGYVGNWIPTLRLSGLVENQSIGSAGITWTSGGLSGTFTGAAGPFGNGDYTSNNPMPSTIAVTPAVTGSEIIITIPIDNNLHEALADQTIKVAIDGYFEDALKTAKFKDKSNVNGACSDASDFEDTVDKIIKARPTVAPVAPNTFPTTAPVTFP